MKTSNKNLNSEMKTKNAMNPQKLTSKVGKKKHDIKTVYGTGENITSCNC